MTEQRSREPQAIDLGSVTQGANALLSLIEKARESSDRLQGEISQSYEPPNIELQDWFAVGEAIHTKLVAGLVSIGELINEESLQQFEEALNPESTARLFSIERGTHHAAVLDFTYLLSKLLERALTDNEILDPNHQPNWREFWRLFKAIDCQAVSARLRTEHRTLLQKVGQSTLPRLDTLTNLQRDVVKAILIKDPEAWRKPREQRPRFYQLELLDLAGYRNTGSNKAAIANLVDKTVLAKLSKRGGYRPDREPS